MMRTGFIYDPDFLEHDAGHGHPECKERLSATIAHLRGLEWFDDLIPIEPKIADPMWIETIHDSSYISRAKQVCDSGAPFLDVADVGVSKRSCEIAHLAVGSAMALADSIVDSKVDNGFILSRPPGHHAERNGALGFCLFNNVAIAARYLQRTHGVDKVLILDFDVHHGNGTQHSFEDDPSVMYASIHQYPYYPGTGAASETGTGKGSGATVNCPMPAGAGDKEYQEAFAARLIPAISEFAPEFVILSAGFDAHVADPLAQIRLSTESFGWMTDRILEATDGSTKTLSILEGGYNIDVLPKCIEAHLRSLMQRND